MVVATVAAALLATSFEAGANRPATTSVAAGAAASSPPRRVRRVAPGELAAALETSGDGDTLLILPGVHRGSQTIERQVRIEGTPGAVIEGDGTGTVLTLAADGIVLSGLTVRGSGADLSRDDAVIRIRDAHGVTIERCKVLARAFGIYVEAGSFNRVLGNRVRGDAALTPSRRGNGIHLWKTTGNEIRSNRLRDVRDGVYLSFAHDNVIGENEGMGLRYGIHYMYSERNRLVANRFRGCTGGIALMFSMDNRIERNETVGNRDFGILCLQLERSTVRANRMARNGRGLYLQNSAANTLIENHIEENGVGVFLTAGSERNEFGDNRFLRNLVQVYEDHPGDNRWTIAGRGNFWSDYVGFDWDGDGIGEAPYRVHTTTSALLARYPAARWFSMSPTFALLDWWGAHLPSFDPRSIDDRPLTRQP